MGSPSMAVDPPNQSLRVLVLMHTAANRQVFHSEPPVIYRSYPFHCAWREAYERRKFVLP